MDINLDGNVDSYDKGYIDSYCENYKIGNDNYNSYKTYEEETEASYESASQESNEKMEYETGGWVVDPDVTPLPTLYPDSEFLPLPTLVDDDMCHVYENESASYDSTFIPVDGEYIEEQIIEEETHSKTR